MKSGEGHCMMSAIYENNFEFLCMNLHFYVKFKFACIRIRNYLRIPINERSQLLFKNAKITQLSLFLLIYTF